MSGDSKVANPVLSVGGMHPMEALSLYNGDGWGDEEVAGIRSRAAQTRERRARGVLPIDRSGTPAHNPPCNGCAFERTCAERALACNIFAEWTVSRRPTGKGIKQLLPSKKWLRLLEDTENLRLIRSEYRAAISKMEGTDVPATDDLFDDR